MSDDSIIDRMAIAISGSPFPSKKSKGKAIAALKAMKCTVKDGKFAPRSQMIFNGMIDAILLEDVMEKEKL